MASPNSKARLLVAAFAFLLVLFPFLFWYSTWFGRPLSDRDLDRYFAAASNPRNAQHALVQLGERLSRGENISPWYPAVLSQSSAANRELRETAAWIMGQVPNHVPFHEALLRLIHDPEPMVRRNAATALAAFHDPAGRPELEAMLQPFTSQSPFAGTLHHRVKIGDYVTPGTVIAQAGPAEIRSPIPGEVLARLHAEGDSIHPGDPLLQLSPDPTHVWESLRALYLIGQPADLEFIDPYTHPLANMPEKVQRQAILTAEAIRHR